MKIISKSDQVTTKWSGGKTNELFIAPQGTSFEKRDFSIRISTATIEAAESTFTPMIGYMRKLMVLEGELILEHEGHHCAKLKPFERDTFSGDWITKSKGKVVDFNVIYRPEFKPDFKVLYGNKDEIIIPSAEHNCFYFLFDGELILEDLTIKKGSSLFFKNEKKRTFLVSKKCVLVVVQF